MAGSFQADNISLTLPDKMDSLSADCLQTDDGFIDMMEVKLLEGSSFATTTKAKEHSIIINEQLSKALGAKQYQDAIGKVIMIGEDPREVIGVIKDFNYVQLEEPIRNFIFFYEPKKISYAYLSLTGKFDDAAMTSLGISWNKVSGNNLFNAKTLALQIEETYLFYINFIKIFGFVALLAIAIGCLGLVGMSLYAAQSRFKEVGIRKVMGASVTTIVLLLSKGFIWVLLIASAIALPLSYLLFNQVLENGVYHIEIGIIELGAGVLILLLAGGITIISQIWKTAVSNPIKSLRTE
jgi:ABC-type antimicrobial peptide transport system permease subunit